MNDCDLRKPGEDFCVDCPLRAVRAQCAREGYCHRTQTAMPAEWQAASRVVVLLLSCLSIAMVPVIARILYRSATDPANRWPLPLAYVTSIVGGSFALLTLLAAGYGLYTAVWSKHRPA